MKNDFSFVFCKFIVYINNDFQGQSYVSQSGETVPRKEFKSVESCCSKECFRQIETTRQQELHEAFWKTGDYLAQNVLISSMMTRKSSAPSKAAAAGKCVQRRTLWTYTFHSEFGNTVVCQKFLLNCLNIEHKRIETVQRKLKTGQTLKDNRGRHENHFIVLTEEVKALIHRHCNLIQHSVSHYTPGSTHPELTLIKLYESFLNFYATVKGKSITRMDISTYSKYFNHNVNFSCTQPRTGVCNYCLLNKDIAESKEEYLQHISDVEKYI